MLCNRCTSILKNLQTSRRHERMQQVGLTERVSRPGRAKPAWITLHMCDICETEWRHVDDPLDPEAGWSIESVPEMC